MLEVQSVSADPHIPLITTVPRETDQAAAMALIYRQRSRMLEGTSYSFAIADALTGVLRFAGAGSESPLAYRLVDGGHLWLEPEAPSEGHVHVAFPRVGERFGGGLVGIVEDLRNLVHRQW